MRLPPFIALLILALVASPAAHGQDAIHRCLDPAGRPVFTDRRCSTLDATPVQSGTVQNANPPGGGTPTDDVQQLCAADPTTLRQQVLDAFARHEPNRLAGLMLWDDYGERGAVERIRALGMLVERPLLGLRDDGGDGSGAWRAAAGPAASIYDASRPLRDQLDDPSAAAPAGTVADPRALIAVTPGDDGDPQETRFAIKRRAGCLWLQPPAG